MKITKNTDELVLIQKLNEGNEEAFNEIYRRYRNLIYYVTKRNCYQAEDVEDIVQETFLTIKDHAKDLRNPKYFRLWIYRIISSKCNNLYRHNSRQISNFDDSFFSQNLLEQRVEHIPSKASRHQSDLDILNACIDCLPQPQKIVIMMYYFEHLSINEISEALDVPSGTIKSRMATARASLKKMLEQIERKQEIKIDFQAFDAMVTLAFTTSFAQLSLPNIAVNKKARKPLDQAKQAFNFIQTHALLATSSALLIGGGAIAYPQLVNNYKDTKLQSDVMKQTQSSFKNVQIHGETISNPKQGFFALQLHACCKEDIASMSIEKLQILIPLYEEMKQNGGTYFEALKQTGWIDEFERKIKK